MEDQKIYFSIPGFQEHFKLNQILLDLMEKYPNKFNPDIVIKSVYGSYPCRWNGGRFFLYSASFQEVLNNLKYYTAQNISIRYVFSNSLLTENDLTDPIGNKILIESLKYTKEQNGVTLVSPLLKEYIEKKYPDYYIVYSTTLMLTDIQSINKYSKNNKLVLNYNLNNEFELLKLLKYKQNIEILAHEYCQPNCPYRIQHYQQISKWWLDLAMDDNFINICPMIKNKLNNNFLNSWNNKTTISIENIRKNYLPLGINHFKLSGRSVNINYTINDYLLYFVKPFYQEEIKQQINKKRENI